MPTTDRTYTALQQANGLVAGGALRGNLDVAELRDAVRALAGLVFVLAQHAKDSTSSNTDALDAAVITAEAIVIDLEFEPGPGRPG